MLVLTCKPGLTSGRRRTSVDGDVETTHSLAAVTVNLFLSVLKIGKLFLFLSFSTSLFILHSDANVHACDLEENVCCNENV